MVEAGALFIGSSAFFMVIQSLLGVRAFWKPSPRQERWAPVFSWIHCCLTIGAFGILCYLHGILDFSCTVVFAHTQNHLPLLYRLGAVWTSSEGSLLLWMVILGVGGGILTRSSFQSSRERAQVLGLWGLFCLSFWVLVIFFFNPFTRLSRIPLEGLGLNPLLHDPSLMIHPPLLYLGYAGLCLPFLFTLKRWICLSVLQSSPVPPLDWVPMMSWTLISWSFLTLGLMTGGIWAYYELGWGGYWFWDPVENIALLPWLWATAMIHWGKGRPPSSRGFELLTMLAFLFVLWGTTLTRGGLLMSVHSFSSLPSRTLPLLVMTLTWTFLCLAFWGASLNLKSSKNGRRDLLGLFDPSLLSKTPIIFLSAVAVVIAFGTFLPPLFAPSVSVDPSFYNRTLWILMIGPFALMPLIPFWGRFKEIFPFFLLAAGVFWILLFFVTFPSFKSALCLGLSVWMGIGSLPLLKQRSQRAQGIGHLGVALCLCGICCSSFWKKDIQTPLIIGEKLFLEKETLLFEKVTLEKKPLFHQEKAFFLLQGETEKEISAEKRLYHPQELITSEAALHPTFFHDLLVTLGDYVKTDTWIVHVSLTPGTWGIWLGGILMILGAIISFFKAKKQPKPRKPKKYQ